MTRITENYLGRSLMNDIMRNRESVSKFSNEVSTGLKVDEPGDSSQSATISQFRETLHRIEGYSSRVQSVKGFLEFQDDTLSEAGDLLIRAKEIASHAASGHVSADARRQMAEEVFEIREHVVALANSTYQGKYVFSGAADNAPAFSKVAAPGYSVPPSGAASDRYSYNSQPGSTLSRSVQVGDEVTVDVNTPGSGIFANAVAGLERLGRALQGYSSATDPGTGLPTGVGGTYTLPQDYELQTNEIRATIDIFSRAKEEDIQLERVSVGGRLRRLDTATSVLNLSKVTAQDVLNGLQNADVAESASNLADAQTALEASFTITSRILQVSVLDYL